MNRHREYETNVFVIPDRTVANQEKKKTRFPRLLLSIKTK